jgi:hypothetical protein
MQRIDLIHNTGRFSFNVVETTRTYNFLERRIIKRVKISSHVAELIEMKHGPFVLVKMPYNRFDEAPFDHRIRIAQDDNVAPRKRQSAVIHKMFVVDAGFGHLHQNPGIHLLGELFQRFGNPRVIFDEHHLELIAVDALTSEIMQQMKAFSHVPVQ